MALSANYKKNMHVGDFHGPPIALVLFTHYFQLMNMQFYLMARKTKIPKNAQYKCMFT